MNFLCSSALDTLDALDLSPILFAGFVLSFCPVMTQLLEARALYDKHYVLERKEIDLETKETSSGKKATNIPKVTNCVMFAEKPKGSRLFAKIKNYR